MGRHQGVRPVNSLHRFFIAAALTVLAGTAFSQVMWRTAGGGQPEGVPMPPEECSVWVTNHNVGNTGPLFFCAVVDEPSGQPPQCPSGSAMHEGYCSAFGPGSPDYSPPLVPGGAPGSPIAPPSSPFSAGNILAAATIGLAALAGLAAGLGAAPIVAGGLLAAAIHAGVMHQTASPSNPPSAQAAVDGPNPPLTVRLQAAATDAPAPAVGDPAPPSIVTNPNGQFAPGGGGAFDGNGATGGWAPTSGGATGEWTYTPAATVSNPTPAPTAAITQGGYAATQQLSPNSSGAANGTLTVERASDGSLVVTQAATVPTSTSGGTPTTIDAATSTPYLANGKPAPGGGGTAVSSTLGNGAPSNGGQGLTMAGSTLGSGATPESVASGGCGSGGTCETTQLANKGLLTAIYDFLSGSAPTPDKPTAKTAAEIKAVGVNAPSGPFGDLLSWTLPAHASTCPTGSFEWNAVTYTLDGHCQLVEDHFGVIRTVLTAVFTVAALVTVLRA